VINLIISSLIFTSFYKKQKEETHFFKYLIKYFFFDEKVIKIKLAGGNTGQINFIENKTNPKGSAWHHHN